MNLLQFLLVLLGIVTLGAAVVLSKRYVRPKSTEQPVFGVIWPQVFVDPESVTYDDTEIGKMRAVADGLSGWACCSASGEGEIPKNFGMGMVVICKRVGTSNADKLQAIADEFLAKKKRIVLEDQ